jgi:hypothetical protein
LRAPAIADRRNLYQVRAPADSLFEAMCGHSVIRSLGWRRRSYAPCATDQAKRNAKGASTRLGAGARRSIPLKKKFAIAGCQQVLHLSSTTFPHAADPGDS